MPSSRWSRRENDPPGTRSVHRPASRPGSARNQSPRFRREKVSREMSNTQRWRCSSCLLETITRCPSGEIRMPKYVPGGMFKGSSRPSRPTQTGAHSGSDHTPPGICASVPLPAMENCPLNVAACANGVHGVSNTLEDDDRRPGQHPAIRIEGCGHEIALAHEDKVARRYVPCVAAPVTSDRSFAGRQGLSHDRRVLPIAMFSGLVVKTRVSPSLTKARCECAASSSSRAVIDGRAPLLRRRPGEFLEAVDRRGWSRRDPNSHCSAGGRRHRSSPPAPLSVANSSQLAVRPEPDPLPVRRKEWQPRVLGALKRREAVSRSSPGVQHRARPCHRRCRQETDRRATGRSRFG